MKVSRLEIFGFKSFLEKLILPLEGGVTGVVGPNGCGKSNIVDALRWVLGETRASQLRGGALEDVIFNGTDTLRPLGLAEVSITLRAREKDFFSELLAPLLRRNTGSTLAVLEGNGGEPAEASGDAEANGETTPESESTRPVLTVIAGAKSERAEDTEAPVAQPEAEAPAESAAEPSPEPAPDSEKVESTDEVSLQDEEAPDEAYVQQLVARYRWLSQVSEVQITRRLYRSGESEFFINRVPCRLRDLKELFRLVGLGARSHTIVAQGEVGRIISARPEERRVIIEEAAGVAGFRDKMNAAGRRLEETAANMTRLEDLIREVTRQVNSLRVQASRAKSREQLKERLLFLQNELFADDFRRFSAKKSEAATKGERARQDEIAKESEFQTALTRLEAVKAEALQVDSAAEEIRTRIDAIQEELRKRAARRLQFSNRLSSLEARVRSLEQEQASGAEQKATLERRREEGAREVERLAEQEAALTTDLGTVGNAPEETLRTLSASLHEARNQLRTIDQRLRAQRDAVVAAESRLKALREQLRAPAPVNQLKHATFPKGVSHEQQQQMRGFFEQLSVSSKVLAETLGVEPRYEKAAHSVLGDYVSYLVTADPLAAAKTYEGLRASLPRMEEGGEVMALAMLKAIAPEEAVSEGTTLDLDGCPIAFQRLAELISCSSESTGIVQRLLRNVYVVENAEAAQNFVEWANNSGRKDASYQVVTLQGGVFTPWSVRGYQAERTLLAVKREADALEETLSGERGTLEQTSREREALLTQIGELEKAHAQALTESQREQARARQLANQRGEIRGRLQAERRVLDQVVSDLQKLELRLEQRRAELSRVIGERSQAEQEMREYQAQDEGSEAALEERLKEERAAYAELEGGRQKVRKEVGESSSALERAREARDQARRNVSQADFDLQRSSIELNTLRDRVVTELNAEGWESLQAAASAGQQLESQTRMSYLEEADKIRTRIHREGEVDSTSIERFEEEQKRLEELTSQRTDLASAAQTLRDTIERLRKTSEERFLQTFDAVAKNFSGLIPRLFGGGHGSLTLTDRERPLASGVEIGVRPPGKKLKSIELMSGGEKALCAIGLIVSMFLERPSPLCVLDEVDAPLDEANLVRFLSVIKEMSAKTQFIMITHNKATMSVADRLVGVTMQTPGASKVVTVSLQEAVQQVA